MLLASKSHRSGRSHHRSSSSSLVLLKEGLLDFMEVPVTLRVIGVTDRVVVAPVSVVVQDTDILGTTVNLQILTVIHLLSDMLGQGVVIETEGRLLIFPRLQLILGIRIGTHSYISLSVWPESMSGPQGRKVKDCSTALVGKLSIMSES